MFFDNDNFNNFRDPKFMNYVKSERRLALESYYSMIFTPPGESMLDLNGLHAQFEELLRERFNFILENPESYHDIAIAQKCTSLNSGSNDDILNCIMNSE